jgi:hypothetical protein
MFLVHLLTPYLRLSSSTSVHHGDLDGADTLRSRCMGVSELESAAVALSWSFHTGTNKEEMEGCKEEVLPLL